MSNKIDSHVVSDLVKASEKMLEAANNLWWAHNPDEDIELGEAPSLEDAQEKHSDAFAELQRAIFYAKCKYHCDN